MITNITEEKTNLSIAVYCKDYDQEHDYFTDTTIKSGRDAGHPFNRDDENFFVRRLYDDLISIGASVDRYEKYIKNDISPTHVIFIDIPKEKSIIKNKVISKSIKIALLSECEVIKPWNYKKSYHDLFDYLFTWTGSVLKTMTNAVYMPCFFSYTDNNLKNYKQYHNIKKEKLCVMIASNKYHTHPLELYSARKSVVEWFNTNRSDDFDLYGYDWDKRYIRSPKPLRILNRSKIFTKSKKDTYKCYKGVAITKIEVMAQYKFSICFENARSLSGYITEKIFDSMISGSIPIYYGSPDIAEHVPGQCFINFQDFDNISELYSYISRISDKEYTEYISAIEEFLTAPHIELYSADFFSKNIIKTITN
jgi:hypothetical protein